MKYIRPVCQECRKEIKDDLCIILDVADDFNTCICDRCMDSFRERNSGYLGRILMEALGEFKPTPHLKYDIIKTEFARCLA